MKLNRAQLLALNLDSHIVVDAGAGTGKTSTIIDRVIEHYLSENQRATRILPKPERPFELSGGMQVSGKSDTQNLREWGGLLPGEVVLLTFTNKAADEMKDRLRKRLTNLKSGPISDDGNIRTDPRIRKEGFPEQLLTLLDDAPIGTIDSFFNQLVSPYRGILGDSLTQENISDSGRILLTESALNILWRLSSQPSRLSEAVDAGVPANRFIGPKEVLESRDRIQRHYAGRNRAIGVIRNLSKRSIFIEEAIKGLSNSEGKIIPEKILDTIIYSINPDDLNYFIQETQNIIFNFCDKVKEYPNELGSSWANETRIGCLDYLASSPPKETTYDKLVWLSYVYNCVVTRKSLFKNSSSDKPTIFPRGNLPSDENNWLRGINNLGKVSSIIKPISEELKKLWNSEIGEIILHFVRLTMVINKETPPCTPVDWENPIFSLNHSIPENHPDVNQDITYGFSLEHEARNLEDLRIVMKGFNGIIEKLKEVNEVHDFDDIQRMAGDLLLANCPKICEKFYPEEVINALNNCPSESWKDDHIINAISILENLEKDSMFNIKESKNDLDRRYDLLKKIRRRYRAFIIDEAQDNSPLQWKLLSRLWGRRHFGETEAYEEPDTPWQPTICYVGDIKQSIYAFRQAEVTGFRNFSEILRGINIHEFNSISELTIPGRELRNRDFSRDPRNSHQITIANAKKHYENGGQDLLGWIPFNQYDGLDVGSQKETDLRKEGYIKLKINYRTDGGLLGVMNEWWDDVFHTRHRRVFNGEFYADPQRLIPATFNSKISGDIEWICPLNHDFSINPSTNLNEYLDAFDSGDSLERQGLMIAKRIKHLIEGKPVRVKSSNGDWDILPTCEKVPPSEIMVLLPSRRNIRDIIIRYLNDFDIPSQADREGGLLDRPAVHTLDGLLQFIARPNDLHNATWVARSCLIGFNDEQINEFIGNSKNNENLLYRLKDLAINSRQRELIEHWIDLSEKGLVNELLEDTLDYSDLLLTYPEESSLQDVEQFIDLVSSLSSELGGDAIVIADKVGQLRENESSTMEAITIPPSDAVRIMTIHGSKGLEASVVFLVDIFSKRQTNLTIDSRSRTMVSPEIFAGNPLPWTDEQQIKSATWMHTKWLYQSRKDAEARRLFYVGATRAKNKLIIVGSPKGTLWDDKESENGLRIPWSYTRPLPQLGQIWLESLKQGSIRRNEEDSVWISQESIGKLDEKEPRYLNPFSMAKNSFLGNDLLSGMTILHNEDCFSVDELETNDEIHTASMKISLKDAAARLSQNNKIQSLIPRVDSHYRVKTAPHRLSVLSECSRRHWFETRGGLISAPIMPISEIFAVDDSESSFDGALFGSVVHRIVEIGIPNPGNLSENSPSLPKSWLQKNPNNLTNYETHKKIYDELLTDESDILKFNDLVLEMTTRLSRSKLGRLVSGEIVDGEKVEGLRTELPFNISFKIPVNGLKRGRWTPSGLDQLSLINDVLVQMDGIIDLVLCTNSELGPSVRPIDLKTEEASKLSSGELDGLLESLGDESYEPACEAELSMLNHHRMQLALYYRALERIESKKEHSRKVLRPAIWVGVTGRLVEYPEELFSKAQKELDEILMKVASIELNPQEDLSQHPPLEISSSEPCDYCPFSKGKIPICGPIKQEL